jgi:predicted dehydrogenase
LLASAAETAQNPPMRFGILGSGTIARFHAMAIQAMDGGELHSIYGRNPETADALGREFGCRVFHDLDAFLADPDLEIVTVATPSGIHLDPTLASLNAGKHVICEKPLEVTPERIDRMAATAKAADRTLACILNRRFHPTVEALERAVAAGRFGRIVSASCHVKWFRDQAYYDSAEWRGTRALDGGGAMMNQAIHAIDLLLHLAGPARVTGAATACLAHERIDVEDSAVASLEFENGALGVIEASTACWSSAGHPARIQLCGTEGSAFLADEAFEIWDFAEPSPEDERIRAEFMARPGAGLGANDPKAIHADGHRRNFEEVAAAIREGREPSTSAASARPAVALIHEIYESTKLSFNTPTKGKLR